MAVSGAAAQSFASVLFPGGHAAHVQILLERLQHLAEQELAQAAAMGIVSTLLTMHNILLQGRVPAQLVARSCQPQYVCDGACSDNGGSACRALEFWPSEWRLPRIGDAEARPCVTRLFTEQFGSRVLPSLRTGIAVKETNPAARLAYSRDVLNLLSPPFRKALGNVRSMMLDAIPGRYEDREGLISRALKNRQGGVLAALFCENVSFRFVDETLHSTPLCEYELTTSALRTKITDETGIMHGALGPYDHSRKWAARFPAQAASSGCHCFLELLWRAGVPIVRGREIGEPQWPEFISLSVHTLAVALTSVVRFQILIADRKPRAPVSLLVRSRAGICKAHAEMYAFACLFLSRPEGHGELEPPGLRHARHDSPILPILVHYCRSFVAWTRETQTAVDGACSRVAEEVIRLSEARWGGPRPPSPPPDTAEMLEEMASMDSIPAIDPMFGLQ